jgi:hypothetical protein
LYPFTFTSDVKAVEENLMQRFIMKSCGHIFLCLAAALPVCATVINFEAQVANTGGNLTGIPDWPLTIGIATFTGGELRDGEVGLNADKTGVYASEGQFGSAKPLRSQPLERATRRGIRGNPFVTVLFRSTYRETFLNTRKDPPGIVPPSIRSENRPGSLKHHGQGSGAQ